MSPPHNLSIIARPRTLAHVLLDLKEARRDWTQAIDDEADDRASEADQRIDDLREEFGEQFLAATGLTWKQIETAISEAVL